MPCAPMMMAVLMPITSPCEATSGPPELPGLSAASVWIDVLDQAAGSGAQRTAERARSRRRSRSIQSRADCRSRPRAGRAAAPWNRRALPTADCVRRIRTQQREVGVGVFAEQARLDHAAFGIGQAEFARALDHVAVGEDQAVRRENDAGADAAGRAAVGVCAFAGLDPHHGGPDAIGNADHGME